jgi:ABC-type branched-subunit amino acid transport system ATPase component
MFRAEALYKSFGALEVAKGISLDLPRGARHAIVGPNGSGKTTLFNLLSGELKPDAGHVYIDGRDVTPLPPDARARAGLTRSFQKNNLFPDLTVEESLVVAVVIGVPSRAPLRVTDVRRRSRSKFASRPFSTPWSAPCLTVRSASSRSVLLWRSSPRSSSSTSPPPA